MNAGHSVLPGGVRYQPDEKIPASLAIGLGLQLTFLNIAAIMLIPAVVMRAAGQPEAYVSWAVLASVAVCGMTTVLQAFRIGRIGTGHVLVMGTSGAFITVCIAAVAKSGPALLATLVIISALVPLVLSWRLSLFQRILTPTVSGTVIMLIPITVMPYASDLLMNAPDEQPVLAAPLSALATVLVISGIALKGTARLRLWAPVIGVIIGSVIAGLYGLYDVDRVADAAWIDVPTNQWPGFDVNFGPTFWMLLPSFLLVAMIASIRTMSSAVAIQRVSWRRQRSVDYRAVQGAMTVDGLGNLLSGLAGTMPGSATTVSVSMTELTGVGARSVGVAAGATFIILVFLPKTIAAVLAIPDAVFAGYLFVLLTMLFIVGIKIIVQDGLDYHKGMIAGISFLVGVAFHYGMIFPDSISEFAGGLLQNGMNAGGFTAIFMTLFMALTEPRRNRLETVLSPSALPQIREFLQAFASNNGWDSAMTDRLDAVSEETLLILMRQDEAGEERDGLHLRLVAHKEDGGAVLEFVVAPREENLHDRLALLGEKADDTPPEREVPLRLLRHMASSVRHQQYYDTDIVTVRVKPPTPSHGASA